jgi:outer membrane lipoprotein carrier protein
MQFRAVSRFLTALAALGALAALPVAGQAPSADGLAASLQKRYATIRDFKADFTQEVQGAILRTVRTTEQGELEVMKPGRVRMQYGPPQRVSFVADGRTVKIYNASDRTGTEEPMPRGDDLSVAILFLAGRGDLVRDFAASVPASHPPDEWQLDLVPHKRQEDLVKLTVFVDRKSLAFRGLTTEDRQGGSFKFRFTNLRENVGLKDSDFQFTFPRGANVIRSGRAQ